MNGGKVSTVQAAAPAAGPEKETSVSAAPVHSTTRLQPSAVLMKDISPVCAAEHWMPSAEVLV